MPDRWKVSSGPRVKKASERGAGALGHGLTGAGGGGGGW